MRDIEFRPRTVRETLVELKDSSELAVDRACSVVRYREEPARSDDAVVAGSHCGHSETWRL